MPETASPKPHTGVPVIWSDGLGRAGIRSAQALLVIALAWTVLWALGRVPFVVVPVTIALILASAISPLVTWLTGHGLPKGISVAASFVGILALFAGVVTGIVFLIRAQSKELVARFTAGLEELHAFLNTGPVKVSDEQLNSARESIQKVFTSNDLAAQALTGARTVGEILAGIVLMAVILFFFLKDGEKIRSFLFGFMPTDHRARAHLAAARSATVLGGYVRGTALVAASNGLIVGTALAIMGVPLALPLGVFVFIGGFIPIVGSTAAGTLAVGVALISNGPAAALIVLAVIIGVNQLEHHLLQPFLMGKVLSIHGLAILLALAAGSVLAGIVGALLAVPVTAVGWTIIKTWSDRDDAETKAIDREEGAAV